MPAAEVADPAGAVACDVAGGAAGRRPRLDVAQEALGGVGEVPGRACLDGLGPIAGIVVGEALDRRGVAGRGRAAPDQLVARVVAVAVVGRGRAVVLSDPGPAVVIVVRVGVGAGGGRRRAGVPGADRAQLVGDAGQPVPRVVRKERLVLLGLVGVRRQIDRADRVVVVGVVDGCPVRRAVGQADPAVLGVPAGAGRARRRVRPAVGPNWPAGVEGFATETF